MEIINGAILFNEEDKKKLKEITEHYCACSEAPYLDSNFSNNEEFINQLWEILNIYGV